MARDAAYCIYIDGGGGGGGGEEEIKINLTGRSDKWTRIIYCIIIYIYIHWSFFSSLILLLLLFFLCDVHYISYILLL